MMVAQDCDGFQKNGSLRRWPTDLSALPQAMAMSATLPAGATTFTRAIVNVDGIGILPP